MSCYIRTGIAFFILANFRKTLKYLTKTCIILQKIVTRACIEKKYRVVSIDNQKQKLPLTDLVIQVMEKVDA